MIQTLEHLVEFRGRSLRKSQNMVSLRWVYDVFNHGSGDGSHENVFIPSPEMIVLDSLLKVKAMTPM